MTIVTTHGHPAYTVPTTDDCGGPVPALRVLFESGVAMKDAKRGTTTARFGSSKRESHDASGFYSRFTPPEITADHSLGQAERVDEIFTLDARRVAETVPANSVALVVTSPPYFAGKEYEETLGENGVPASYFEYLQLLADVFAACKTVLEPGGRIAVNVANLGRRPYRSLSGDVTQILSDLGLLLRGEVIWWKGRAAGGSCAWGTFQRPSNPVLRDVTERVVIASKGRFDRALTPKQRLDQGRPSTTTITRDEFLEATTDMWELPTASATRVGHPAPFPVELPQRLIELYTYEGDLVLDPFMGAGSTAVAAVRTGRHYLGFETDQTYVDRANTRIEAERAEIAAAHTDVAALRVSIPAVTTRSSASTPSTEDLGEARFVAAVRDGRQPRFLAELLLADVGFSNVRADVRVPRVGVSLTFVATDRHGADWAFDVSGAFTSSPAGLKRADTLWRALGKAAVLRESPAALPLILLTTATPTAGSAADKALRAVTGPGKPVWDVIDLLDPIGRARLAGHAKNGRT